MMMYDGWGHMMWWHWLIWLVVLILVVAAAVALIRLLTDRSGAVPRRNEALEVLEARYAKGMIGRDEYLERRRDLIGR